MSGVLKFLENEGVLFNIVVKKEIRSHLGISVRPGKKSSRNISTTSMRRAGGRPSIYKITEFFEKTRNVMTKPEAHALLKDRLLRTHLTYKFERFGLVAFLHCARMDYRVAENMMMWGAPPSRLPAVSELRPYLQSISSLDDRQIEVFADQYSKWLAENRPYDLYFLFSLAKL